MIVERVDYDPRCTELTPVRRTRPEALRCVAARLAAWSDQAKTAGRTERSEYLLLRAWEAYELGSDSV